MSDRFRQYHRAEKEQSPKEHASQKLLHDLFSEEEYQVKAVCGLNVRPQYLATTDNYRADKGTNPELWCEVCFGGG